MTVPYKHKSSRISGNDFGTELWLILFEQDDLQVTNKNSSQLAISSSLSVMHNSKFASEAMNATEKGPGDERCDAEVNEE